MGRAQRKGEDKAARAGRWRRPFDFPFFPPEDAIASRAHDAGADVVLAELVAEGDQQSGRAGALVTAAALAIATAAVTRVAAGLADWQYAITLVFAGGGLAAALIAQVTRVGALSVGLAAEPEDVRHAYWAVRRRAFWLELATWTVGVALALVALFALSLAST